MPSARLTKPAVAIGATAAVIALWQYANMAGWANRVLLPAPSTVFPQVFELLISGEFIGPLVYTLSLLFLSFSMASVAGVLLGLMMGTSKALYLLLDPLIEVIRPIPKVALIAPLFLLFGIGYQTMLIITVLAQFFPILINTIHGARGVDSVLLNTARTMRMSRSATILKVVFPAALPMILAGMRVAIAIGLVLAIMSEMLAGDGGIGFLVLDYERSFETVLLFAWVSILALVGLILAYGFEAFERVILPWRGH